MREIAEAIILGEGLRKSKSVPVNHIDKKPSQVALGKPIVKRGRKQQRLIHRVWKEVLTDVSNLKQKTDALTAGKFPHLCPTDSEAMEKRGTGIREQGSGISRRETSLPVLRSGLGCGVIPPFPR